MSHQQQVPGLKEVGDALHHIGDLSPQEKDQLVKGVVVIVHLLGPAVLQVEQPEVLLQIAPLVDLLPVRHLLPLFRPPEHPPGHPWPWNRAPRPMRQGRFAGILPHIADFHNRHRKRRPQFGGRGFICRLCFSPGFAILKKNTQR